jgi:hypothetical protein
VRANAAGAGALSVDKKVSKAGFWVGRERMVG